MVWAAAKFQIAKNGAGASAGAPGCSATHTMPYDTMKYNGAIAVDSTATEEEDFLRSVKRDIGASLSTKERLTIYERLNPAAFRFFLHFTLHKQLLASPALDSGSSLASSSVDKASSSSSTANQEFHRVVKLLIQVCGAAFTKNVFASSAADANEFEAFYPQLDLQSLTCVVMHNDSHVRLIFPNMIVSAERALRIHRYVLECIEVMLDVRTKRMLFCNDEALPHTDKVFRIPHAARYHTVCPNSVYVDDVGVALLGTTEARRCTAVSGRRKDAHSSCLACDCTGYVPSNGRWMLACVYEDATEPTMNVDQYEAMREDLYTALVITRLSLAAAAHPANMASVSSSSSSNSPPSISFLPSSASGASLCSLAENGSLLLTEPFLVPSYAPPVAIRQQQGHVRREALDCFETERGTFGRQIVSQSKRKTMGDAAVPAQGIGGSATVGVASRAGNGAAKKVELDMNSRNYRDVSLLLAILQACRGVNPNYANIGLHRVLRYTNKRSFTYRVLSDGVNSCYCMRAATKFHERCRASFVFEIDDATRRAVVCQECFAPECSSGGKRYKSRGIELSQSLCRLLGFPVQAEAGTSESHRAMISSACTRLFEQMHGRDPPPLKEVKRRRR